MTDTVIHGCRASVKQIDWVIFTILLFQFMQISNKSSVGQNLLSQWFKFLEEVNLATTPCKEIIMGIKSTSVVI